MTEQRLEAVSCAVAMQSGMARRNKNIAGDVRIEFRIGVNLGDVIVEKGDVFGDGVNSVRWAFYCSDRG